MIVIVVVHIHPLSTEIPSTFSCSNWKLILFNSFAIAASTYLALFFLYAFPTFLGSVCGANVVLSRMCVKHCCRQRVKFVLCQTVPYMHCTPDRNQNAVKVCNCYCARGRRTLVVVEGKMNENRAHEVKTCRRFYVEVWTTSDGEPNDAVGWLQVVSNGAMRMSKWMSSSKMG